MSRPSPRAFDTHAAYYTTYIYMYYSICDTYVGHPGWRTTDEWGANEVLCVARIKRRTRERSQSFGRDDGPLVEQLGGSDG